MRTALAALLSFAALSISSSALAQDAPGKTGKTVALPEPAALELELTIFGGAEVGLIPIEGSNYPGMFGPFGRLDVLVTHGVAHLDDAHQFVLAIGYHGTVDVGIDSPLLPTAAVVQRHGLAAQVRVGTLLASLSAGFAHAAFPELNVHGFGGYGDLLVGVSFGPVVVGFAFGVEVFAGEAEPLPAETVALQLGGTTF